ncbi:MAG: hypothetical protein ThorAB25_10850 [Candidatus Thorarchaeota archaeon AB_25]|nr:MAG: hypothetical protein ThorAB25_10850 [Candidatus Thorarchaeota archaeon AB_25]
MLTFSELKSKCKQAIAKQPPFEDEESISVLYQNDWVRILTVHDTDTIENWRIEVEVSLPSQTDPESGIDVKNFVQSLIKHLEYLLRLDNEGLTLGVMSRDGLWTAYLEIENLPPDSLFKALIPPSVL